MTHKYEVGDRVELYDGRVVTIVECDYKNDWPLYDLDDGHWVYETQIKKIV